MRPKPVLLPPPNCVRKPNTKMVLDSDTLYIEASFSLISLLDTFARPGCSTSTTNCLRASSRLVMNLRVRSVQDELMAAAGTPAGACGGGGRGRGASPGRWTRARRRCGPRGRAAGAAGWRGRPSPSRKPGA